MVNSVLLFVLVTTTVATVKSQGVSCPFSKPVEGESCDPKVTMGKCRYDAFAYPGSTSISFLTRCDCDPSTSTFVCSNNDLLPPCAPPTPDGSCPETADDAVQLSVCPFQDSDAQKECNYDPFGCPGSDDAGFFITRCNCEGGDFFCNVAAIIPCDDPQPEPVAQDPVTECPFTAPDRGTPCDVNARIGECRYAPYACNGDSEISFNTFCECASNGEFECTVNSPPFNECPTRVEDDCPYESPLVKPVDDCSSVNPEKMCYYDPFGCPGEDDVGNFLTRCTCGEDGQFICSQQTVDCRKKPPKPPLTTECPINKPFDGESCDPKATNGICRYDPFACPRSTSILFLTRCDCDSVTSTFVCTDNDLPTPCVPPNPDDPCPETADDAYQISICPFQDGDGVEECTYNPYGCPGSDDAGVFTTRCSCEGDDFICVVAGGIICDNEPPPAPVTECPVKSPAGENIPCDANEVVAECRYDPFACNGDSNITFTTVCVCASNGAFDCTVDAVLPDRCPATEEDDCPLESPLVTPVEDCSFVNPNKQCNYDPFGCPGKKDAGDFITRCTCQDDGQFVCSQARVDCSKKDTFPTFDICFAGESQVEVQGKGLISMDQLAIGDKVLVDHDNLVYEPVYSFGHFGPKTRAAFIEIRTTSSHQPSLKLSPDHMVMLADEGTFVPASSLQIDDALFDAVNGKDAVIVSIKTVTSQGVYAPFTPSGKLIVNGIVVSSFVAMGPSNGFFFSWQWIAHTFEFPHRVSCYYLGSCPNEMYTELGISNWVAIPHAAGQWMMRQKAVARSILMGVCLLVLSLLFIVESVLFKPTLFMWTAGLAIAAPFVLLLRPPKSISPC